MASRSLHGLATDGNAPKVLLRLNRFGIPWVAVAVSDVFGALAYMAVQSTAYTVFFWL
jgi:amino acid transporter